MKSRTKGLNGRLKKIEEEVEQQQITNRQDNIVFFGVPEKEGRESNDDCASTMVILLNQHDPLRRRKSDDMARVQRLGREKPIERGAEAVDHARSCRRTAVATTGRRCPTDGKRRAASTQCSRGTSTNDARFPAPLEAANVAVAEPNQTTEQCTRPGHQIVVHSSIANVRHKKAYVFLTGMWRDCSQIRRGRIYSVREFVWYNLLHGNFFSISERTRLLSRFCSVFSTSC